MNLSGMEWKRVVDDLYRSVNFHIERREQKAKEVGRTHPEYLMEQIISSITLNIAQALEFGRKR